MSVKLEGVASFDVARNIEEQYVYRWESGDSVLSDDVVPFPKEGAITSRRILKFKNLSAGP